MAKSILGVAFGPGVIHAAELSYDAKSAKLVNVAEFNFGETDTLQMPADLGKKFGAFLKENKFSAKQAVAGLPTQWLLLKEKNVPTMSADNLAGMLRLQAERDFSLEPQSLILDCVSGDADAAGARPLLLAAALRERVDQISATLKGAGLSVKVVTSSALALASATGAGTLLSAGAFGAELLIQLRGNLHAPAMLASSVSENGAWIPAVGSEGRRALALRALDSEAPVGLWNGAGISRGNIDDLSSALGVPLRPIAKITGVDSGAVSDLGRFSQASALAAFGRTDRLGALNFLDSKLVEKNEGAFAKVRWWMAAAVVLFLGGMIWLAVNWVQDARELVALKQITDARKVESDASDAFVKRFHSTQGWYSKHPNLLDCLNELMHVIPNDGTAWMTNLQVKDEYHCVLSAKAVNDKRYFEVFDRLEKNEYFRDVKLVHMSQQDKKKPDVAFAISFVFWQPEVKKDAPVEAPVSTKTTIKTNENNF